MSDIDWEERKKIHQVVVCAACRQGDLIIAGARHFDTVMNGQLRVLKSTGWESEGHWEQGFINQFGDFLTREEAWNIAVSQRQIWRFVGNQKSLYVQDELYSENLYPDRHNQFNKLD